MLFGNLKSVKLIAIEAVQNQISSFQKTLQ
jgi:hypothetical protein